MLYFLGCYLKCLFFLIEEKKKYFQVKGTKLHLHKTFFSNIFLITFKYRALLFSTLIFQKHCYKNIVCYFYQRMTLSTLNNNEFVLVQFLGT